VKTQNLYCVGLGYIAYWGNGVKTYNIAWVIGFGQDQGFASQKCSISYGYVHLYAINA